MNQVEEEQSGCVLERERKDRGIKRKKKRFGPQAEKR